MTIPGSTIGCVNPVISSAWRYDSGTAWPFYVSGIVFHGELLCIVGLMKKYG